ncbi:TIGR03767 family metallophosphoesterase [Actinocorallia longicatena]|uniref:TIGR03767 family metallophosphoesterase n=1 Tax=Actinocorallia longicatena TaxID=111803 RepID=A0ABP6QJF0_9ACTN
MSAVTPDTPRSGKPVSRRKVLKSAALGAVTSGLVVYPARGAGAKPGLRGPIAGTTLERTLRLGPPGKGGYRKVVAAAGEPHLLRDDLGGRAARGRATKRTPVLAFTHLTDVHIVDAQSPARVEYLDRLGDPDSLLSTLPVASAYRPQELLTTQVAETMVRAVNRVGRGPVTGAPLAFTINTGDAADNAQLNEVRWVIDVLDGEKVRPDSGDRHRYEGVMAWADRRYWHPEGGKTDLPTALHGFPKVPGLLAAARRPFDATGLRTPWLAVFGNHDALVQGNLPHLPLLKEMAVGGVKIVAPVSEAEKRELEDVLRRGDKAAIKKMTESRSGLFRQVTPDPSRRLLSRAEVIREHGLTHGYTAANLRDGTAYYAFDRGRVRGLVLDTCNQAGYADGSLDRPQFAWLERQLAASSSRYLSKSGAPVRHSVTDRLVVLFSHHTLDTMANPLGGGRILGPEIEKLLLRFPNVVLWVNGHTHVNEIVPHARKGGGGFWEVSTAAHIDWPQQSRLIEIADNHDGTLSIFGTILDTAAPTSHGGRLGDPAHLAALSRELSGNDWQRDLKAPGEHKDRNVELLLPAPF